MLVNSLLLILGLAVLIKGADWLVSGASALAKKYHVSDVDEMEKKNPLAGAEDFKAWAAQQKMKKALWTPIASHSIVETVDFISELWNDQVADDFLRQLDYRIEQIQQNPELAPPFKNSEFRQLIVHKSVSLFYREYEEHLKLLLVWDNRQNPIQLFEKLTAAGKR